MKRNDNCIFIQKVTNIHDFMHNVDYLSHFYFWRAYGCVYLHIFLSHLCRISVADLAKPAQILPHHPIFTQILLSPYLLYFQHLWTFFKNYDECIMGEHKAASQILSQLS